MTTIAARVAYAIFGDYDGNAPDTCDLAIRDTREEAEADAKRAHELLSDDEGDEQAKSEALEEVLDVVPFVDGWQHCLRLRVREVLVRA